MLTQSGGGEGELTSLEMLADYECPECGQFVDELTEDEASAVFAGDKNGNMRCPHDWCDEELQLTPDAAADNLEWIAERLAANRASDVQSSGSHG